MGKDKTIIEKFADTLRDVAKTATEAASEALKAERPATSGVEERTAAYVPLAADGLISDPLMVPPMAQTRPRRKKRAAAKRSRATARKPAKKSVRKSKSAKKSTARKSSRTASSKSARKTRTPAKRRGTKSRRR